MKEGHLIDIANCNMFGKNFLAWWTGYQTPGISEKPIMMTL